MQVGVGRGWIAWGLSLAGALSVAVGCGDSTSNQAAGAAGAGGASSAAGTSNAGNRATSGGQPSTAGATNGGSTSTAGSSTGEVSQHAACLEYVAQYCTFRERCKGTRQAEADACTRAAAERCPDVLFSEGSTRTPENLLQCASAWSTWSCDDFGKGLEPDCVTPGTKAIGEPCAFPSQCSSLSCSNNSGCGVCEPSAPPAGPCADGVRCGTAQICVNGSECRPDPDYNRDGKPGDACSEEQGCNDASYCNKAGTCVALPEANAPCQESARCVTGTRCNFDNHICEPLPGPGQPCSTDILSPGCALGAHCEDTLCAVDPKEGEPCYIGSCAFGFSCRNATPDLPGTCKARGSTPDCARDFDCSDGSVCRDDTCKLLVEIGAACDATHGCPERSECASGQCQPGPSQGLFAKVCQ